MGIYEECDACTFRILLEWGGKRLPMVYKNFSTRKEAENHAKYVKSHKMIYGNPARVKVIEFRYEP